MDGGYGYNLQMYILECCMICLIEESYKLFCHTPYEHHFYNIVEIF